MSKDTCVDLHLCSCDPILIKNNLWRKEIIYLRGYSSSSSQVKTGSDEEAMGILLIG